MARKRKNPPIDVTLHVLPAHDSAGEPLWLITGGEEFSFDLGVVDDLPVYAYELHEPDDGPEFWRVDDELIDDATDGVEALLEKQNANMLYCESCASWIDGGKDICETWGGLMDDVVKAGFELRDEEDKEFKVERGLPLLEWFKRIATSPEMKIFGKMMVDSRKSDMRSYLRQRYGIDISDEVVDQIIDAVFGNGSTANPAGSAGEMTFAQACEVLGVEKTASKEEILKAFRTKAHETHPDKGGPSEAFVRVVKAREILLGEI